MRLSFAPRIIRLSIIVISIFLLLPSCGLSSSRSGPDPSRPWKASITETDQVRTVSTTDGSVWEGEAHLIEEASIGSADSDEEYMLIQPAGISADHQRRRIAISDYRVPIVRIYNFEGKHLFDVGREGDGPGEYRQIRGVYLNQDDGRIFVHQYMTHWINIYDVDGTYLDRWEYDMAKGQGAMRFKQGADGLLYIHHLKRILETGEFIQSMIAFSLDGTAVDTLQIPAFEVEALRVSSSAGSTAIPFSPYSMWTITVSGELVWGYADSYSFSIYSDSGEELVIRKYWDKVPVLSEEADWRKDSITRWLRSSEPSWQWHGAPIPSHKPAFNTFYADLNNRIWVQSEGPSIRLAGMIEAPDEEIRSSRYSSWRAKHRLDLFDRDGRYLGPVTFADKGYTQFTIWYAKGDVVLALMQDENGISHIKRYRLVIPH